MMSRGIHLLIFMAGWLSFVPRLAVAQDMALKDILIDGEDWQLVGEGFAFTEGPAVDSQGTLYFTDVFRAKIYRLDAGGKPEIFVDQSYGTNGMMFGPDGRLYGCQNAKKRIVAYDSAGKDTPIAEDVNSNDIVVMRSGALYFTDPEHHQVWYVSPQGEKRVVDTGLGYPNGIRLWPDQGTLVVADMKGPHLWAYRVETNGDLDSAETEHDIQVGAAGPGAGRHAAGPANVRSDRPLMRRDRITPKSLARQRRLCRTQARHAVRHLQQQGLQAKSQGDRVPVFRSAGWEVIRSSSVT